MARILPAIALLLLSLTVQAQQSCAEALNTSVRKLHSQQILDLCALTQGKLTLVVNTASDCGYTPQFKALEALYQTYREDGLIVIGFPSNDFRQERDSESDTAEVCYVNYGVTFPMAATSSVKGEAANPVFQQLNQATEAPGWNFNKYLVSTDGREILHFESDDEPRGGKLEAVIRARLK